MKPTRLCKGVGCDHGPEGGSASFHLMCYVEYYDAKWMVEEYHLADDANPSRCPECQPPTAVHDSE